MTNLAGKVELWPIENLVPYQDNAKQHPPEQIQSLAHAIKTFGWDQPIVVDELGEILKGHGRRLAALELGLEKVPVLIREGLTDAQKKLIRVSDNTLALLGHIDMSQLNDEMQALLSTETDLDGLLDDLSISLFMEDLSVDLPSLRETPAKPSERPVATPKPTPTKDYSLPDLSRERAAQQLFQVVCDCEDEVDQQAVYDMIVATGRKCRILTIG